MKAEDLRGHKFGHLTVLERAEDHVSKNGKKRVRWKCICDCEDQTITYVLASNLKQGKVVSCGCYKRNVTDFKKKYNKFDLNGEFGIGYASNYDSYGRNEFYFDLEDYNKIKDCCWYFNDQDYLLAHAGEANVRMHRIITEAEDELEVDHIHGKETRNDNRKSNLREVTHAQNNWNKDKMITNTSGYRGVTLDKRVNKWTAQIDCEGKHMYLGRFNNIIDAYKTRLDAENKLFGKYSFDNSINS